MPSQARFGGSWQALVGSPVFASGAWRSTLRIVVYASGAWQEVANFSPPAPPPGGGGGGSSPMTLSISPSSQSAHGSASSITSSPATATPSGGVAPYTYSWTVASPDGISIINSPSSATTTFRQNGMILGEEAAPGFTCTATDSLGATASATCSVTFSRS